MSTAPNLSSQTLAAGRGWRLDDVRCSAGPDDRAHEERHERASISFVVAGTFSYRSRRGSSLLTPGAVLLGNSGQCYRCSHEHGVGDRCVSFMLEPAFFEEVAADLPGWRGPAVFAEQRLPPLDRLAPVAARLRAALDGDRGVDDAEELAVAVAGEALRLASGLPRERRMPSSDDERRIAAVVRHLEKRFDEPADLDRLAGLAAMSRFHFLRVFREVVGMTPHRYLVRLRLLAAAERLRDPARAITDVAFEVGFGDLSTFNRAFRGAFGVPPSGLRWEAGRDARRR